MLGSSEQPLEEAYDLVMLDLDGVVYVGRDAVPGAADHLRRATEAGARCAFVTNNASRPASAVAEHLRELGVEASVDDVVTSAQAAASLVRERHGEGAVVRLLGGEGLWQSFADAGLRPVPVVDEPGSRPHDDEPAALVTGYGPDVRWSEVMRAAVLVRDGLPWVASNTDMTIPTAYGVAPGHGVLVDTLRRFSQVEPAVAGKPARPLLDETISRVGGARPLMVGDRLDTDIEGGRNSGVDTLLVLTGVTGLGEVLGAAPASRPTYLAPDLGALHQPHQAPREHDGAWELGGWVARVRDGRLEVSGSGDPGDWWRVVACAGWQHLDEHGEPVGADASQVPDAPVTGR